MNDFTLWERELTPAAGTCYAQEPGTWIGCGLERGHDGDHRWEIDAIRYGEEV